MAIADDVAYRFHRGYHYQMSKRKTTLTLTDYQAHAERLAEHLDDPMLLRTLRDPQVQRQSLEYARSQGVMREDLEAMNMKLESQKFAAAFYAVLRAVGASRRSGHGSGGGERN